MVHLPVIYDTKLLAATQYSYVAQVDQKRLGFSPNFGLQINFSRKYPLHKHQPEVIVFVLGKSSVYTFELGKSPIFNLQLQNRIT